MKNEFTCPVCGYPYPVISYKANVNEDIMSFETPRGGICFELAGETLRQVIPIDRPEGKITPETIVNCLSCNQQSKLGEWVIIAEPPPEGQMEIT